MEELDPILDRVTKDPTQFNIQIVSARVFIIIARRMDYEAIKISYNNLIPPIE